MAIDPALNSLISQFGAMGQSTAPDVNKMVALENQILSKMQADMQAAEHQVPVYQPPVQAYTDAQGVQQSFQPLPADPNAVFQTDMQAELHNPIYSGFTNPNMAANLGAGVQMPAMPQMPPMPPTATLQYTVLPPANPVLGRLLQSGVNSDQQLIDASHQSIVQASVQFNYNYTPITSNWVYQPSAQAQAEINNLLQTAPRGEGHGTGAFAVRLAEHRVGQAACQVKMANYHHAGGVTNDCADFVSSCIADAGLFHKTSSDASVTAFRRNLIDQGYHGVPKGKAQPGDVAIIIGNGVTHTELVATPGATQCIGANGTTWETISKDNLQWAGSTVEFFHKS